MSQKNDGYYINVNIIINEEDLERLTKFPNFI